MECIHSTIHSIQANFARRCRKSKQICDTSLRFSFSIMNKLNLLPAPDDAEIEGAAHNDEAAADGEAEAAPAPAGL